MCGGAAILSARRVVAAVRLRAMEGNADCTHCTGTRSNTASRFVGFALAGPHAFSVKGRRTPRKISPSIAVCLVSQTSPVGLSFWKCVVASVG